MYSQIDQLIIFRVREGFSSFANIFSSNLKEEAERIAKEQSKGRTVRDRVDAWRILDRRLQALRKKGAIKYASKTGWSLT